MLKEFALSLNNTKIIKLIPVYWFLQKLLFADAIKEKEKAELEKMKRKKRKIDTVKVEFSEKNVGDPN